MLNINFHPSTFCYLDLRTSGNSPYGRIGCGFDENIELARDYVEDQKLEWGILAKIGGDWIVIAQSKNWHKELTRTTE
jgi:hypothetical protein